jgi:alcohol dehydrogenase class IV
MGVAWVQDLCAALDVPPLSQYHVTENDFGELIAKSQKSSSMKGNPIALTGEELTDILKQAL